MFSDNKNELVSSKGYRAYKIFPFENEFKINGLATAFSFKWDKEHTPKGESHEMWELIILESGCIEVTENENIYTLKGKNAILHAPLEFHCVRNHPNTVSKGYIISFCAEGKLPSKLREGVFTLTETDILEYEKIHQKASNFIKSGGNNLESAEIASYLLSAFLLELSLNTTHLEMSSLTTQSALEYHKIVSTMKDHVCDNLSLDDFAALCYISTSYLKLLFNKYLGKSPKSYYNSLRLQYAITLLEKSLSIEQIAAVMNFSSSNYFSFFFKKHFGISPSEYRKKMD